MMLFLLLSMAQHHLAMAADSLSIDECVAIAKANNPDLSIAARETLAAEFKKTAAAKASLPLFKFSGGAGYAPWSLSFGYDPAVSNGGELGARVIAEQTLYDGGLRSLDFRLAALDVDYQGLAYRRTEVDLIYEARDMFIGLLRAQQEQSSHAESVSRLADYVDLVRRLNKAGTAAYTDLLSARIELTNARTATMTAAQAVALAKYRLAQIMGSPGDTVFTAVGSLDSLLVVAEEIGEPLPEIDSLTNLDMKTARINYRRSQIEIQQVRAERMPSVSLVGDIGVLSSRENLQMPPSERFNSVGYSIGIGVEIPLWDWGRRKALIQQRVVNSRAALDRIRMVDQSILIQYRMLQTQMDSAVRRLRCIRAMLENARQNYTLIIAKYSDGYASVRDVLAAEQLLTGSRLSEIETLAEIQSHRAKYERLAGIEQ
jgi:outer membrane protein